MGRPLNKKYFGNRNIGTGGNQTNAHGASNNVDPGGSIVDGDDHIGGEGIAGIAVTNPGNYINRLPTFQTFSDPTIANGVRAQTVLHSVARNCSPAAPGTGYRVGDVVTDRNGSTWTVTGLQVVSFAVTNPNAAGNTNYDLGNVVALDSNNDSNWLSPFVIKPITVGTGGNSAKLSGGTIDRGGVWTGTGVPPTSFTLTSANTRGDLTPLGALHNGLTNYGGTGDTNAAGATISVVWGIATATILHSIDYAYGTSYYFAGDNTVTGGNGTAASLSVGFGIDHIAVTQKGSGYTGAEALAFSTAPTLGEVLATGTYVLTADTGAVGSATNQENAIIAYVYMDGSIQEADIAKQVSTDRYRINTGETGNLDAPFYTAKLKTTLVASGDDVSDYGNMWKTKMNIWAFDSDNGSYLVKKLTAHKAVIYPVACARLSRSAGAQFPLVNGMAKQVPWTFDSAQEGYSVQIENA